MVEYFQKLFESSGFIPRGNSFFWLPEVLATNIIGDGLMIFAFLTIPAVLFVITSKRNDFAHKKIFNLFAIFIFFCGITHLIELATIWSPVYRLEGAIKILTGLVAVFAAFVLFRNLKTLLRLPSHNRLEELNKQLRNEVEERERAQIALRQANEALETRVQQRTAQLIKTNRELEREIDVRKKTENDLMEKNLELVRINSDLDNFVYCASHNLKAPIVNIEGLVTALKEELPRPTPHMNEILDRLDGSLLKVDRTVLDLTEVSRLQKSSSTEQREMLSFAQILAEVKAEIPDLIAETNAEITADFSGAETVYFSHQNLKSVLYNLLTNAIKYHHEARKPEVFIQTETDDKCIILSVTDNGAGIDLPKHEQKTFSMFRRLNDTVAGSGIGLYIVKRILDNNNCRIKVQSTLGEGSTFEVFFPKS